MGREAQLGVAQVGGDVIEPRRQAYSFGEVAGTPMGDEGGVERVGRSLRCADFYGEALRVLGESGCARGVSAVNPRAGERRGETAARRHVVDRVVRLVEQRGNLARMHTE